MHVIKFSHIYPKLWGQDQAELIAIRLINRKDMHQDLIEYDTKTKLGTYYPLPPNDYIQLVFIGNKNIPFCTLRRMTQEKFDYYKQFIGQQFKIELVLKGGEGNG